MKLRTLEELEKLQKKSAEKTGQRAGAQLKGVNAEITVGMATCGIAAGAEDVLDAINDEVEKLKLDNTKVVKVGCIGFCHYEPIVQVNIPGREPVYYGNVDTGTAREIVRKHVANREYVDGSIINLSFEKA